MGQVLISRELCNLVYLEKGIVAVIDEIEFVFLYLEKGIVAVTDEIEFDDTVCIFFSTTASTAPTSIINYLKNITTPFLTEKVSAHRFGWTNNNSESINHILKQYTQWRPQHLLELINKLRQIVNQQFMEVDRIITSLNDFMLRLSQSR